MLKGIIRRIVSKKGRAMAKNERRHGKSARNGNAPAPYTKYKKQPFQYNIRAWETKWPHLASTLWDAQRAGHRLPDEVYKKSEDNTKYLKKAA